MKGTTSTNLMTNKKGEYTRNPAKHRRVDAEGNPKAALVVEPGRYHLHVALACPWACGTLTMLYLKGLEDAVSVSVVHPTWQRTKPDVEGDTHCGWVYKKEGDEPLSNPLGHGKFECDAALKPDTFTNAKTVRELYESVGDTTGPYSTPVLYDKREKTFVSNESTEILRIFNNDFASMAKNADFNMYPEELEEELCKLNDELVYPHVNNGVYRCGFAKSQPAYDSAVAGLFSALEELEKRLGKTRFLGSDVAFTWLDMRLFQTLVRFDPVYTCYFKTNIKRISDFPNLLGFVRDVYAMGAVKRAINMDHIKVHYYTSHPHLNTFGIIPASNGADLDVPHGRGPPIKGLHDESEGKGE